MKRDPRTDNEHLKDLIQKLREENTRLRAAQENSGIGTYEWDILTNKIVWSPQLEKMYGLPKGGFSGQFGKTEKYNHPDDKEMVRIETERAITEGKKLDYEYRIIRPDKTIRWLHAVGKTFYDKKGKPVKLIGTVTDITKQKNVDNELRQSEERFRLAMDAGKLGAWDWDIESDYITWTDQVYVLHGLKKNQFDGSMKDFAKVIHPEDRAMLVETINKAVKGISGFTSEFRTILPDKSIRWLFTEGVTFPDERGKAARMVGATFDITDRKQTEINMRFLSEASRILSSSLDYNATLNRVAQLAIPYLADWCTVEMIENGEIKQLALSHKDPKKIEWANEIRKKYPPSINDIGTQIMLKEKKSQLYPVITPKMLKQGALDAEHYNLLKKINMTSAMSSPIIVNDEVIGTLNFISCELGRHYNENDLLIAEKIASRAALCIQNARLYTEMKKAVAIRDDFISIASHELRTPVTSLKMYTQILQKQVETMNIPELALPLSKMNIQISKLTNLIKDLLDVSKMQVGKLEFREEKFDLSEIITEIVENVQATSPKHKIHVIGSITKPVFGDRDRIGQVITNLLTNAIKYSPVADKVNVHLSSTKDQAVISVEDFGIGIDAEHQKKIFERFYRVNDDNERTFPGLGIGLYIASEIVKRHDGEMKVESIPGKGSTFSFTVPFA